MKAQELRIENLVNYNGKVVKVEQITKRKIGYNTKPNETRMNYARLCEVEPIPITEELLLKCGFEKIENTFFLKPYVSIYETCNGWFVHIDDEKFQTAVAIPIKYIHQLQNAYYLATNKELEIEL